MADRLEFYFDVASPASYIAHARLPAIIERTGAILILRPVLAGGIFKLSGNASPAGVAVKRAYMMEVDLPRIARHHSIALDFHPNAPFNSLTLMRGALVADEEGRQAEYVAAIFNAMWAEARNLSDPAAVAEALATAGFDAEATFARVQAQTIKDGLISATATAVNRGVFGVPTFFAGSEMFFGQDRLDFIEQVLIASTNIHT